MIENELRKELEKKARAVNDLIAKRSPNGYEVKGILKPMNPYRSCCLNCVNFNEPYCDRIQGVRVFKDRPRKMTRCGYFERIKRQKNG